MWFSARIFVIICDIHNWFNLWDSKAYETLPNNKNHICFHLYLKHNCYNSCHNVERLACLSETFLMLTLNSHSLQIFDYPHEHNLYEDFRHFCEFVYCTINTGMTGWWKIWSVTNLQPTYVLLFLNLYFHYHLCFWPAINVQSLFLCFLIFLNYLQSLLSHDE